ncbi:bile acid:sodium symporter family protein [Salsipaludibacter albus]|uniref:bile acid:sodium symporter family protein n=1 Tax=Salsipaludibacter albus TaxID=2849650 RepID=UPI001EE3F7F3|nr:bile acid:sodium symporter family protein [Salsipaludibacter albus]MBY5163930.1 bile acid:sodium symporter family protein [Salsipaludibacter albus]
MSEVLTEIANVALLTFVLSSMLALGLSLTVQQVVQPLTDLRLVGLALVANFVVAPLAAWGIAELLGLDDPLKLGLLLLGCAAGAPFLPKLAQFAKADVPYSVGLMVLLMVVTVAYVPLVLVPLVEGVEVSAWDIARPLILGMLLPLAIALVVRARYDDAKKLAPHLNQVSTVTVALALVLGLVIGLPQLIDAFGTGSFVAVLLFIAVCLGAGYLLGGSTRGQRLVTGFGTAQRNVSAALLIATTSFADQPEVLILVMVGAVLMAVILMPLAAELGGRVPEAADA